MGARPIAAMNALSFGEKDHPKTRSLVHGVVEGIGGYGNCFGVPTIGGEVRFHPAYNGNCLVNAFAAGLVETDKIFYSAASGVGMPVVYLGAKTGRDGVGGATMASRGVRRHDRGKAPHRAGRRPLHRKAPAGGLPRADGHGRGDLDPGHGRGGPDLLGGGDGRQGRAWHPADLDHVPQREDAMTAYEMMLSESQERMLMVLRPEKEAEARAVFEKWDLDFAIVGETIPEDRFVIIHGNETVADLPLSKLSSEAPEYDRPWVESPPAPRWSRCRRSIPMDALKTLIASPNYCSRAWIYEQYDTPSWPTRSARPAGRGRRAGARHRQGAGLHLGRDPALRARQSHRRRQAGGGGGLPQPLRRGGAAARPPPTTSISATPRSRRSWASSSARSKASARRARRSTCRSSRAT
jgi:hypothetical protein